MGNQDPHVSKLRVLLFLPAVPSLLWLALLPWVEAARLPRELGTGELVSRVLVPSALLALQRLPLLGTALRLTGIGLALLLGRPSILGS